MIRNEFKAHSDGIIYLTVIKEPLCFVTTSRDKFVKIWDINCNCLGVINALPKLSKLEGELPPWKFKVNEEKILEDEIAEVVGIFEDVGVEPIEVGSKMDREVDRIQVREKIENVEQPKKEIAQFIKRKFKKLEKIEHKKDFLTNDNKAGLSYEGFFVQNAQKQIETLLEEQVPNVGINEIAKIFMNNVVETENEKLLEKKKLKELEKTKLHEQSKQGEINSPMKKGSKYINYSSNKALNRGLKMLVLNSLQTSSKTQNQFSQRKKTDIKKIISNNSSQNTLIKNYNSNQITSNEKDDYNVTDTPKYSTFKKGFKKRVEGIVNNMRPVQTSISGPVKIEKKENLELIMPENLELDNIKKNLKSKTKNVIKRNNRFKDTFYSERFFGKTSEHQHLKTEIEKKEERIRSIDNFKKNLSNLYLPFLNDNIIFQKGETEKLLNLNFYKTSYKACCEISKQFDMPNSCIRKNYKNNWKLVKQYTKDIKNLKIDDEKKKSTSTDFFKKSLKNRYSSLFEKKK
jgi:hypothetical protein